MFWRLKFSYWEVLYMHGWFFTSKSLLRQGNPFKILKWLSAVNSDSPLQLMWGLVTLPIKQYDESTLSILNGSPELHTYCNSYIVTPRCRQCKEFSKAQSNPRKRFLTAAWTLWGKLRKKCRPQQLLGTWLLVAFGICLVTEAAAIIKTGRISMCFKRTVSLRDAGVEPVQ
jgi:hypothetical protein